MWIFLYCECACVWIFLFCKCVWIFLYCTYVCVYGYFCFITPRIITLHLRFRMFQSGYSFDLCGCYVVVDVFTRVSLTWSLWIYMRWCLPVWIFLWLAWLCSISLVLPVFVYVDIYLYGICNWVSKWINVKLAFVFAFTKTNIHEMIKIHNMNIYW